MMILDYVIADFSDLKTDTNYSAIALYVEESL